MPGMTSVPRLVAKEYRAQPAKRVWIPKSDGGQRPLAILVLEDKIVQRAVAMILEAIYEPHFCDFSYGLRSERNAHQALTYLRQQCLRQGINWVVDADIQKFFDCGGTTSITGCEATSRCWKRPIGTRE